MATVVTAIIPLIQRDIIDNVIVTHTRSIWPLAIALLVAAAVNFGLTFVRRYSGGKLSLDVQHDLRTEMLGALSRLDGARQDEIHTGQLVSRSISDINMIQGLLSFLPITIGSALLFVVSIGIMLALSPLLTLVALAVAPALWAIALRSRRKLFPASWHAQQQSGEVAAIVDESVGGVRVVKGFGQEDQELERMEGASAHLYASRVRLARLMARFNPALQAVPTLGQVGVLALGGWLAIQGSISLGTFLAFSSYLAHDVRPGPDAHRPGHHRAGGAGQRHPRAGSHRLPARDHRQARRGAAAGRRDRDRVRRRPVRLRALRTGAARPLAARRARARPSRSSAPPARASRRSHCCCRASTT